MLAHKLKTTIEAELSKIFKTNIIIKEIRSLSGGCINNAALLISNKERFFIKWNSANKYPGMFQVEMDGLLLLSNANNIALPKAIFAGEVDDTAFLLLNYVDSASQKNNFWEHFGQSLALLHKNTNAEFGLAHNNYIGALYQYNAFEKTWPEFFVNQRLEKQVKMAFDKHLLNTVHLKHFNGLYQQLGNIFPNEPPALLHGDLWSGNYLTGADGLACIIDPAVYYGHREMDLGMSKLFGGFSAAFYASYNQTYPLEKSWSQRTDICNLYPLLVHLNLFGLSYLRNIDVVIRKF